MIERNEVLLLENYENTDKIIMTLSMLNDVINLEIKKPCYSSMKINIYRKDEQLLFRIVYKLLY